MRSLLTLVFTAQVLLAGFAVQAASSLMIHQAWIPEMPPVSKVHAGFASFHNMTDKAITITAVSSPDYDRIEMHLSKEADGMARMIPQKTLVVQANEMLVLQHGSYHLMMFKPKRALKSGDTVELTITLADGSQQTFSANVRKSDNSMQHDHEHHHHH